MGRGFHLLLYSKESAWLHICLTPPRAEMEVFFQSRGTAVRYLGFREPTKAERRWLEKVCGELPRLDANPQWFDFLARAFNESSRLMPLEPPRDGRRLTSGGELLLRITGRCNARCPFCSARGMLPDLVTSLPWVSDELRRGVARGLRSVSFTGGEPCLVPWLAGAVAEARNQGYRQIGLQSHGLALARPGLRDRLVAAGLSWAFLSLHSANAEIHDGLLGRYGAFNRVMAAAEWLGGAGLQLGFNCVLTRRNLTAGGVEGLVRLLVDRFRGVKVHLSLSFCSPQGRAIENLDLMPDLTEAAKVMRRGVQLGLELGLRVNIPGLCGVPMCVLPDCLEHFDEYHEENPPRLPERTYLEDCGACRLRSRCSGFWRLYLEQRGPAGMDPRALDGANLPKRKRAPAGRKR